GVEMMGVKKVLCACFLFLSSLIFPAERYYVKPSGNDLSSGTSWDEAFATISKAIQTAQQFDEIWVACGTFQEGAEIVIPPNVKLYGGFMGTELELSERDNATSITVIDGNNTHRCIGMYSEITSIDSFHITNGYATSGAGIFNRGKVTKCVLYGNTATDYGGGLFNDYGMVTSCTLFQNHCGMMGGGITNSQSSGTISGCVVYDNTAKNGAGIGIFEGTITGCIVYKNVAESFGGGIVNYFGGTIKNCAIFQNEAKVGGGVYLQQGSLSHCRIFRNQATTAGGVQNYGMTTNCAIYRNTANYGGGACVYDGTFSNSVLYQNEGIDKGGGLYMWDGTVTGCIIYNSINEDMDYTSGTLEYSCFGSALPTSGNIDVNPLFEGALDFHLKDVSPCIDAGNPGVSWNDSCLPPGKETERNDMGVYGGPDNCFSLPNHMPKENDYIDYLLGKSKSKILDLNIDHIIDIADLVSLKILKCD
ncbi:hypothetical protein JW926_00310, partial [Candidatus Sumerlaeota bacterium]|nr:hypothetical protein [Candidatus Sumerlaeota bacterium]